MAQKKLSRSGHNYSGDTCQNEEAKDKGAIAFQSVVRGEAMDDGAPEHARSPLGKKAETRPSRPKTIARKSGSSDPPFGSRGPLISSTAQCPPIPGVFIIPLFMHAKLREAIEGSASPKLGSIFKGP